MLVSLSQTGKGSSRTWKCSKCNKGNNSPTTISTGQFVFSEYMPVLQAKMNQKMISDTLSKHVDGKFAEVLNELDQLKKTVNDQNLKIKTLEKKIDETNKALEDQKEQTATLQLQVNDLEQEKLALNVEILGVQKKDNEDLHSVVRDIAEVMKVPETAENVEAVYRGRTTKNKPQVIVVKFKYAEDKQKWLDRKKSEEFKNYARPYSAVAGAAAGSRGPQKPSISIFEQLTFKNRQLLFDTRTAATKNGVKFVWTKGGKIFARKDEKTPVAMRIRTTADIITKIELNKGADQKIDKNPMKTSQAPQND
ncbi:uncharacterized protein LOC132201947 [Neocloeon triangulifer]|uniref:uncharacterized protein LOC132201947 n=1 Tax=Neocloeon triangulifer TaxID=2078957 RepID=UPI00286F32F6|nr:uncharacterized protein LOC132201947 [Neocloeon triangulifer]